MTEFSCPAGCSAYITAREDVVCIGTEIEMSSCNHEKADTRIVVHMKHALENCSKTAQVRTQTLLLSLLACFMTFQILKPD